MNLSRPLLILCLVAEITVRFEPRVPFRIQLYPELHPFQMYRIWTKNLVDASNNPEVKLVIITGVGDYFSSGNDLTTFIKPLQSGTPIAQVASEGRAILYQFVAAFIDCNKPLVALINGPAIGISVTTLGLYDFVVTADHATFHTPFVNLGQTPEGCSSHTFPQIMGPLRANDMLLFNRKLTAQEALEWGLVNRMFPANEFSSSCDRLLQEMAQLPSETLRFSKEIMRARDRDVLHAVNERECERLAERWTSQECMQAVSQFFKRTSQ
ncbi:Enoyl-CoA delta isomerase 2 mitochondrial [Fasciola hepatica]|uniref:Enoyl-CoA delta isomerase 2 mitochondrial n=1 Tax=Fasciola hepatica TaxID=6192 RepID=A0A4E0S1Y2_FASHE|nr:Enoyl-CoA delta isomerase 2 mitochondrial [Fasciola hepatica]